MMRMLFVAGMALVGGLRAQTPIRFADIPWGSDATTMTRLMLAQGLRLDSVTHDGDYHYSGTLARFPAQVIGLMTPDARLAKVFVNLLTPDPDCRQAYRDMKDVLGRKYGAPLLTLERFDNPYYEGDGYELSAIKLGKGHFSTAWEQVSDNSADTAAVTVYIGRSLVVLLAYEGPRWNAEAERRAAKGTKAF